VAENQEEENPVKEEEEHLEIEDEK